MADDGRRENQPASSGGADSEVCPVCRVSTPGGDHFKSHLRVCLENNLPVVKSNEEVLLSARGSLECEDQLKTEPKPEAQLRQPPVDSEDDWLSDEDEAVDARQLYPCRQKADSLGACFDFLAEDQELLPPEVIKSIEIMQKSCFANVDLSAGKMRSYSCVRSGNIRNIKEYLMPNICLSCRRELESSREYASHLYAHTFIRNPGGDQPVICSACGITLRDVRRDQENLTTISNLINPSTMHHPPSIQLFISPLTGSLPPSQEQKLLGKTR